MNSRHDVFSPSRILLIFFITLFGVFVVAANTIADFDGDGKSDVSVFRRSNGYWYILKSSGGTLFVRWGLQNDVPVPGDYDGDGKADIAVYRYGDFNNELYDSFYYILRSSDNSFFFKQFGRTTGFVFDIPTLPADFDGDGKTDFAAYEGKDIFASPVRYSILQSSTNSIVSAQWGHNADRHVPADYDGDGKADLAVCRTFIFPGGNLSQAIWYILQSSNNSVRVEHFGLPSDQFVPADYTGDGKTDIAVWRPSNGFWYRINSNDNSFTQSQFGLSGDKPVPADYDGDNKTDVAVFRPSDGIWYLQKSTEGFAAQPFGLASDVPIPNTLTR
jgi:hypothetical protein